MIYICSTHKEEMKLFRITQGDKTLGYLWMCTMDECDETVEPTQEEIDNYCQAE